MACSKWEQVGLLYTSGELSEADAREYERHVEACRECREEIDMYKMEREQFYSEEMLGASPSPEVGKEILRVCGAKAQTTFSFAIFGTVVTRPVAAALLFLLLGIGTGTYVAYHADNAQRIAEQNQAPEQELLASDTSGNTPANPIASADTQDEKSDLSRADSAADTTPFPRPSSARSPGVRPVDLENK